MTRLPILALFAVVVAFAEPPLIIPHIADGGGWRSTVVIHSSSSLARLLITFRGGDGQKIAVPVTNFGTVSSLEVEMTAASSIYLETSGTASNVRVGWVEVSQLAGAAPVRAFAVFRQSVPGRPDFEAVSMGARPSDSVTFPFDNTNGLATSFAVVNTAPAACTITVSPIYDEFGNLLSTEQKVIGHLLANGHSAFVAADKIPELANKRGHLTFGPILGCGSGGVAVLGLRFNPSGPFTNLPPLGTSLF